MISRFPSLTSVRVASWTSLRSKVHEGRRASPTKKKRGSFSGILPASFALFHHTSTLPVPSQSHRERSNGQELQEGSPAFDIPAYARRNFSERLV